MAENGYTNSLRILGIPDRLVEHGTPAQLYKEIGIDAEGIIKEVKNLKPVNVLVEN